MDNSVTMQFKYWIRDTVWVRFNGSIRKEVVKSIHIGERWVNEELIDYPAFFLEGYSIPFYYENMAATREELESEKPPPAMAKQC